MYIVLILLVVIVIYCLIIYNKFVNLNHIVKEAFATMDVYLKKRWDLIPNIVEVTKGYASHEKNTLEEVIKYRNMNYNGLSQDIKLGSSEILANNINRLMILAESYPKLKASENFIKLNDTLIKIEDEIANSRKYYNGAVRKFNNFVQIFPNNIFANMFGFNEKKMYEINSSERQNQKIDI